ncbi:hypothetical protein J6590_106852 [Homalodisca vitripennis]|nr:hypothetical protein J6590_106852 [Homalodisca vitripennis]
MPVRVRRHYLLGVADVTYERAKQSQGASVWLSPQTKLSCSTILCIIESWNANNADRESWILPHTDAFAYSSCVQLSPSDPPLSNLTTPLHHRPKMIRRGHLPPTRPPTGQTRQ